jgi:hypothetical protein
MTRATITIKRLNGLYCQLWYVNSDGYPKDGLGQEIFENLKTVDDVERAVVIFQKAKCHSTLETNFTLGEVESIEDILEQINDYSYVLDEATGKWGFYEYKENKIYDLEIHLKEEGYVKKCEYKDYHNYEFERKNYPVDMKKVSISDAINFNMFFLAGMNEIAQMFGYEVLFSQVGNGKEWYKMLKRGA